MTWRGYRPELNPKERQQEKARGVFLENLKRQFPDNWKHKQMASHEWDEETKKARAKYLELI